MVERRVRDAEAASSNLVASMMMKILRNALNTAFLRIFLCQKDMLYSLKWGRKTGTLWDPKDTFGCFWDSFGTLFGTLNDRRAGVLTN